jgi:hypothetical protein
MMKTKVLVAALMLVAAGLSAPAGAADVTVLNSGFEDPGFTDGNWDFGVPDWDTYGPGGTSGTWNPDATGDIFYGYGGVAPEGENVGWLDSGEIDNTPEDPDDDDFTEVEAGIAQILTETLTEGMKYTLTVEVGNNSYYGWGGYKVQLLAGGSTDGEEVTGGTLLAEDDNSVAVESDTFETSTVMYTYDAADEALLEQPLQIRLIAKVGTGELDVDDVRLTVIPEPATVALVGMAVLSLIACLIGRKRL